MIEIRNLTSKYVDKKFFEKVVRVVLRGEKKRLDVSIVIMSPKEIQSLNRRYRKKDSPTDVLSFKYDGFGEIVLCMDIIKRHAKDLEVAFKRNLSLTLIHGILHLLGYDHEKLKKESVIMENKQNLYLKKI